MRPRLTVLFCLFLLAGPIVKLRLGPAEPVMVTGHVLANELCTRKDFVKFPAGAVRHLKALAPEGLFTADHGEEFWELAHRVLVPAFGPMSVRSMFPGALTRPACPPPRSDPISSLLSRLLLGGYIDPTADPLRRNARYCVTDGHEVGSLRRRRAHRRRLRFYAPDSGYYCPVGGLGSGKYWSLQGISNTLIWAC